MFANRINDSIMHTFVPLPKKVSIELSWEPGCIAENLPVNNDLVRFISRFA